MTIPRRELLKEIVVGGAITVWAGRLPESVLASVQPVPIGPAGDFARPQILVARSPYDELFLAGAFAAVAELGRVPRRTA